MRALKINFIPSVARDSSSSLLIFRSPHFRSPVFPSPRFPSLNLPFSPPYSSSSPTLPYPPLHSRAMRTCCVIENLTSGASCHGPLARFSASERTTAGVSRCQKTGEAPELMPKYTRCVPICTHSIPETSFDSRNQPRYPPPILQL